MPDIGACEQLRWHLDAERPGRFSIDYKLVLRWFLCTGMSASFAPLSTLAASVANTVSGMTPRTGSNADFPENPTLAPMVVIF